VQKKWGAVLLLCAALFMDARPAAAEEIPKHIYQWVQSTARQGYYFNKEQIQYATDAHGYIDLTKIVVPTLRIYDNIQIQDVVSKRRWRMLPLDGYSDLSGAAEYLLIDLRAGGAPPPPPQGAGGSRASPAREENTKEITLSALSDKDVEKKFFDAIIQYAAANQEALIRRSRGILTDADRAALAAAKQQTIEEPANTHEKPAKKGKKAKNKKEK